MGPGSSLIRWFVGKVLRLPPRRTGRIACDRLIPLPLRDGTLTIADRYYDPASPKAPTVLIRTPYGRGAMFGVMAGLMAERGLQVLIQSVRGTAGSEGEFAPMRQERADGVDTLDWVRAQPWFGGKLFTWGMSYLGNVQWAMAMDRAEQIDGLSLGVTLSNFRDEFVGNGSFTERGMMSWTQTMQQLVGVGPEAKLKRQRPEPVDHLHLPVGTLDAATLGKQVPWWREWTAHGDPADPHWQQFDFGAGVTKAKAPALMVAGWNDIFLPAQLRDFTARQAAGLPSWLTIGPWQHASPGGFKAGIMDAVTALPRIAAGQAPCPDRAAVRLYVNGAKEWRDYPSWPPPGAEPVRWHLAADGRLNEATPEGSGVLARYSYDPADPTPAVHGPMLMGGAKVRDMAVLEARSDTVRFTAEPFASDCEAIGPVAVELLVRTDAVSTDFYACVCEVSPRGKAIQVCDGLIRLPPGEADGDGQRRARIELWPTAWRFAKGSRLRLIIASGAHPRYSRNLGLGQPLATASEMVVQRQEILAGTLNFLRTC